MEHTKHQQERAWEGHLKTMALVANTNRESKEQQAPASADNPYAKPTTPDFLHLSNLKQWPVNPS